MDILKEIVTHGVAALATMVVLFFLTKLMGKRQISQLSFFDYITGIAIGSIAGEATVDPNTFVSGMAGMFVYGLGAVLISLGTCKYIRLRRFVNGSSILLYEDGRIFERNLAKARIDVGELLVQCRQSGYYDLSKLFCVILETNGKLSFIPKAAERAPTTGDLKIVLPQERLLSNVVLDGKVMAENLRYTGNGEAWLLRELELQRVRLEDVFLATCDVDNKVRVYRRSGDKGKGDLFS